MKPTPPCKDCQDREIGCHGKCPKWTDYEQAKLDYFKLKVDANRSDCLYMSVMKKQKNKRMRRKKNGGR